MDSPPLERLRTLSRRLQWATWLLLAATVATPAVVLATGGPLALLPLPPHIAVHPEAPSWGGAAALVGISLLVPLCYTASLLALHRLFGALARGAVFSREATGAVRLLGVGLLAIDPVKMLVAFLTGPMLSWAGATEPFISVGVELSMLIAGLFVLAMGRVLELSQELYERDQLTI